MAAENVVGSRVDYERGASISVRELPEADRVKKLSVRLANTVPHFDPNA